MIKELVMLQRFPPPPGMQPGQNARADMLRRLSAGGFAGLTACTLVCRPPLAHQECCKSAAWPEAKLRCLTVLCPHLIFSEQVVTCSGAGPKAFVLHMQLPS